ncbi:carboxypeptidase regulatory-like domain-containing protein [Sphingosinicella microcystinivorans]|uniref:Carboxypeptidase family protein n=1 Tax=Sphingosinicella microcystinivorans TaxID=335406 RepID=A0AAD1FZW6_SPHMI|nr:hypothetical protein [Sphingosinicella microcystinivorans]RKS85443.1 carboxypeptidase family protein [Sphingosinicella microcystinivorans]BBE33267.1 hypothetical protein SmB9_09250 [Sphingosinicella microcystinivorans]
MTALIALLLVGLSSGSNATNGSGATARIDGKVVSPSGEPVPGARVYLVDTFLAAVAERDGSFAITDVPPANTSSPRRALIARPGWCRWPWRGATTGRSR